MNNRILTICAAIAAGMAGASLAHAQQGYPTSPGPVYSATPGPYVPGGYAPEERRGPAPDFDALDEDDEMPNAQASTALPPPGPVLSPNDPRYGRPAGAPVYSDRGVPMPTGPILSPDDPRYGRPAGAPVYSDRGPPMPTGPILSPDDPRYGRPAGPPPVIYSNRDDGRGRPDDRLRPPEAVGGGPAVTGAVPQQPPGGEIRVEPGPLGPSSSSSTSKSIGRGAAR